MVCREQESLGRPGKSGVGRKVTGGAVNFGRGACLLSMVSMSVATSKERLSSACPRKGRCDSAMATSLAGM